MLDAFSLVGPTSTKYKAIPMLEAFLCLFPKKCTNDAIVAKLLRTPNRSATILELPYLCVNFPRPNSSQVCRWACTTGPSTSHLVEVSDAWRQGATPSSGYRVFLLSFPQMHKAMRPLTGGTSRSQGAHTALTAPNKLLPSGLKLHQKKRWHGGTSLPQQRHCWCTSKAPH